MKNKSNPKTNKLNKVETISLNDLLKKFNAPKYIDYLSIDTEGSEFEILSSLDFSKYISVITCEHNYSSKRKKFLIYCLNTVIIEFMKDYLGGMIGMLKRILENKKLYKLIKRI